MLRSMEESRFNFVYAPLVESLQDFLSDESVKLQLQLQYWHAIPQIPEDITHRIDSIQALSAATTSFLLTKGFSQQVSATIAAVLPILLIDREPTPEKLLFGIRTFLYLCDSVEHSQQGISEINNRTQAKTMDWGTATDYEKVVHVAHVIKAAVSGLPSIRNQISPQFSTLFDNNRPQADQNWYSVLESLMRVPKPFSRLINTNGLGVCLPIGVLVDSVLAMVDRSNEIKRALVYCLEFNGEKFETHVRHNVLIDSDSQGAPIFMPVDTSSLNTTLGHSVEIGGPVKEYGVTAFDYNSIISSLMYNYIDSFNTNTTPQQQIHMVDALAQATGGYGFQVSSKLFFSLVQTSQELQTNGEYLFAQAKNLWEQLYKELCLRQQLRTITPTGKDGVVYLLINMAQLLPVLKDKAQALLWLVALAQEVQQAYGGLNGFLKTAQVQGVVLDKYQIELLKSLFELGK